MDEYETPIKSKGKAAKVASPKDDAASDLLAAITAGDAKAVSLALERHYEACAEGHEDDEEEV